MSKLEIDVCGQYQKALEKAFDKLLSQPLTNLSNSYFQYSSLIQNSKFLKNACKVQKSDKNWAKQITDQKLNQNQNLIKE